MEWLAFIKCYFGIMIAYYGILIAYDWFVSSKKVWAPDESEISYALENLVQEEDHPANVAKEEQQDVSASPESFPDARAQTSMSPVHPLAQHTAQAAAEQKISFATPPQGQGIPLAEFIEKARSLSKQIAFD